MLHRSLELSSHPIVFVCAAIQRAGRQHEQKVSALRHLREDLLCPLAGVESVDVEKYVVAFAGEFHFQVARERFACCITPVADEDRLRTHAELDSNRIRTASWLAMGRIVLHLPASKY